MKTNLFLLLACFSMVQALAQDVLPSQLLGNWLSPQNNEWKYGFHQQYAVADGTFWEYEIVKAKKDKVELLLKKGNEQRKLYIRLAKDNSAKIGSSKKDAVLLTQQRNEQPDYAHYDQTGFLLPLIQPGTFQLKGVINGYAPRQDDYKYVKVIYNHLIEDKQKNYVAELDSLGRFRLEFPLLNPQEIMLAYGREMISFMAAPGSNLLICINPEKASKPTTTAAFLEAIKTRDNLQFMGREGMLNTEINDYEYNLTRILDFSMDNEQLKKSDQEAYKAFRIGKMEEQLQHLKAYAQQHRSGKRFVQQLEQRIKYSAAEDLLRYSWLKDRKRVRLTKEYLTFSNDIPADFELGVVTQHYARYLRELSNPNFTGLPAFNFEVPITQIVEAAKLAGYSFKPEDEAALKANLSENGSTSTAPLTVTYKDAFDAGMNKIMFTRAAERTEQALDLMRGPEKANIASDIMLARIIEEMLSQNLTLSDAELAHYKTKFKQRVLFEAIEAQNTKVKNLLAGKMPEAANIINPLETAQNKILESLLSKYTGKVVYIDFWAPWCGPCIGEMPNSKTLKEELIGKDVVFLYLGVECTKESWEKSIKSSAIEGEHYLLNKDEYTLLSERFQIGGIPRYILVDKTGKVADTNAKRPSEKTALLQDINHLLLK